IPACSCVGAWVGRLLVDGVLGLVGRGVDGVLRSFLGVGHGVAGVGACFVGGGRDVRGHTAGGGLGSVGGVRGGGGGVAGGSVGRFGGALHGAVSAGFRSLFLLAASGDGNGGGEHQYGEQLIHDFILVCLLEEWTSIQTSSPPPASLSLK